MNILEIILADFLLEKDSLSAALLEANEIVNIKMNKPKHFRKSGIELQKQEFSVLEKNATILRNELETCKANFYEKQKLVTAMHIACGNPLTKDNISERFAGKTGSGINRFAKFIIEKTETELSESTVKNIINQVCFADLRYKAHGNLMLRSNRSV